MNFLFGSWPKTCDVCVDLGPSVLSERTWSQISRVEVMSATHNFSEISTPLGTFWLWKITKKISVPKLSARQTIDWSFHNLRVQFCLLFFPPNKHVTHHLHQKFSNQRGFLTQYQTYGDMWHKLLCPLCIRVCLACWQGIPRVNLLNTTWGDP